MAESFNWGMTAGTLFEEVEEKVDALGGVDGEIGEKVVLLLP